MRRRLGLFLSLVIGLAWSAPAAADEFGRTGYFRQATFLDELAQQGSGDLGQDGQALPMPDYGPGLAPQPWPDPWGGGGYGEPPRPPAFTVSADLVTMERVGGRPGTLISRIDTGAELLNVTDLNFSFSPGVRIDAIVYGGGAWDAEFAGFGIDNWNASAYRLVEGTGIQFLAPGGFVAASVTPGDALKFDYSTRFYTFEANLRNRFGSRLTLLGGFRWAELTERFQGSFFAPPPIDFALPFWENRVRNHLYGFQVGGDLIVYEGASLRINAMAKGGIFGNHAVQSTTSNFPVVLPGVSAVANRGAFLGEAGMTAVWQATEHLAYRFGYQAMWLDGVALSPNQIHVTNLSTGKASVDTKGTAFFHGAVFGLEAKY